jgi:hypothetical protein
MPFQILDPITGEVSIQGGTPTVGPTVTKAPPAPTSPVAPTTSAISPVEMRARILAAQLKAKQDAASSGIVFAAGAGPATQSGAPSGTIPTRGTYTAGSQTGYIPTGAAGTSARVRAPAATGVAAAPVAAGTIGGLSMNTLLPIAAIGLILLMRR